MRRGTTVREKRGPRKADAGEMVRIADVRRTPSASLRQRERSADGTSTVLRGGFRIGGQAGARGDDAPDALLRRCGDAVLLREDACLGELFADVWDLEVVHRDEDVVLGNTDGLPGIDGRGRAEGVKEGVPWALNVHAGARDGDETDGGVVPVVFAWLERCNGGYCTAGFVHLEARRVSVQESGTLKEAGRTGCVGCPSMIPCSQAILGESNVGAFWGRCS